MELRAHSTPAATRPRPFMTCAQCAEAIHVAQWSEHVDERRVRHVWECDACGYTFETLACFPVR